MKPIKIKLDIDPTNELVLSALNNLLIVIGGNTEKTVYAKYSNKDAFTGKIAGIINVAKKDLNEAKISTKNAIATVDGNTGNANALIDDSDSSEQDNNATTPVLLQNQNTVSIEDVREAVGKKVSAHRETIKAQLTKLGAKNVGTLSAEHFKTFKTFLNGLD